jgi:cytidylate kinase
MFQGFLSPLHPPMSLSMREYVRVVGLVIRDLAHDGDVIIVGRGGQMVLRDTPGTLHVRVIASFAQRIERLMARREIGGREATAQLRASDRARANYLRRYHGVGWQNPRLYHLMLNTDDIPLSVAIAAAVGACRALDESAQTETLEQDRQESGNDDA